MKKKNYSYTKLTGITVGMQSQEDRNLQLLRGKVLLNEAESRMLFVQSAPRGARSRELMRTAHSRLVCTPQGRYTLTFRFEPEEEGLPVSLVSEMKSIVEKELSNKNKRKERLL